MENIKNLNEAIDKWEEYKNTHSKEEIIADIEKCFSLDKDNDIGKTMAYIYYDMIESYVSHL